MAELAPTRIPFLWHTFDLRAELPPRWDTRILALAEARSTSRTLVASSTTSRERDRSQEIPVLTVGGHVVAQELPWLYDLYRNRFRDLAQELTGEPVSVAEDVRYGINLNVQRGAGMRYECHVDSNPIQGLLYVTSHPAGTGGDLVVSNRGAVYGRDTIDEDATRIYPVAGYLVLFDARDHSHYVDDVRASTHLRVVAAMNFYTPSCPEAARPEDLNRHLFGND